MTSLSDFADYVAPAATMIAACMTAANLGPRVTGWGFVVFTAGSLAWCAIGFSTGQQSLLITNGFLTLVNVVGIWRWLGRIARFDDGAKAAEAKSRDAATPTLVNVGAVAGRNVTHVHGAKIGNAVGLMAAKDSGRIAYMVVGVGGIGGLGERIVALPWETIDLGDEAFVTTLDHAAIAALPAQDAADWPLRAQAVCTE